MKKLLLPLLLTLCTIFTFAQKTPNLKGYKKWVDIGVGLDTKFSESFYELNFTNGYHFNNYIFVGGGIGLSVYNYSDELMRIKPVIIRDKYMEIEGASDFAIPLYTSFRAYFSSGKIAPYFHMDLGYVFGNTNEREIVTAGLFFNPNIGVNFNLGEDFKQSIFFQLGIHTQENSNLLNWDLEEGARVKINVNIGFRF
jgi:hypothetical protein